MVRTRSSSRVIPVLVLCCLAGCQSAEKAAITPMGPEGPTMTFAELMSRVRQQLKAAHEFYYTDRWKDVEQAGVALRETSTYIGALKLTNVTDAQKAKLLQVTKDFAEAADQLKAAGTEQNANKTSQAFLRLNEIYRQLNIEQVTLAPSAPPVTTPPATNPPAEKKL